MKILIVDDSKVARKQIRGACESCQLSLTIEEAESAILAIKQIKSFGPQLVICDYNMPTMNGMRLLKLVRDAQPNVVFAFVTGNMAERDRELARNLGAEHILTKPLAPEQVAEVVSATHGKLAS